MDAIRWIRDIPQDIRFAIRTLRKSPSFASVAVLTLAVGIGATTSIYSVVDTVLVKPLPFADSDRLVRIVENVPTLPGRPPRQRGVSYGDFLEWGKRSRTLHDLIATGLFQRLMLTDDGTARLWGATVSTNALTQLGARPMLGRTFDARDDADPDVLVLSFETWQRHFRSDRDVIGRAVEMRPDWSARLTDVAERRLMTIVGVLPASFEFPTGPTDFYTPFVVTAASSRLAGVTVMGYLGPGVSMQTAAEEANVIGSAVRPPSPANAPPLNVPRFEVQGVKDQIVQSLRPALRVFLVAVGVVLLIVCANVANLLLARGTARQREMAVRLAIGAGRGRIARQVLSECLVLASLGGALGGLLAAGGVTLVKELASVEAPGIFRLGLGTSMLPRGTEVGVDLKMFGVAYGLAALASVVFGLLPALQVPDTKQLHTMGLRGSAGRRESRIRTALVVGQLVMATVLLVAAGLLIHSFVKLSRVEKGYDPSNVLAFQLVFPADYSIPRKTEIIDAVLARLRATPTIEAAGFTRHGILIGEEIIVGTFVPPGRTLEEMQADPAKPRLRPVSHGYLTAVGARLLEGRELEAGDTTASMPAIVISRTVARQLFGAGGAVGQILDWYPPPPVRASAVQVQVVGVVEDVRNGSLDRAPNPEIFVDYRRLLAIQQQQWQHPLQRQNELSIGFLSFAVRTRGNPASAAPAVGQIVRSIDPNAGIDAILPLDRLVASSLARQRLYAVLLGVFAAVAGFLAAIGVYGVLAYAVVQRTQEIGIRMALGARRAQVMTLVLRKGLVLTAIGILLGLGGAAAGSRVLQGMLFGITPLDLKTFVAVSLMFALVATFASFVPARRATKVDPAIALRTE